MALPLSALAPDPAILAAAVALDLVLGDPRYPAHPVRLVGLTLVRIEAGLRRLGADGYAGGVALFVTLGAVWTGAAVALVAGAHAVHVSAGWIAELFVVYSSVALGDLLRHGWRVELALARGDLGAARAAVGDLVGRDTGRMDAGACRRAVIESLAESLTDGFLTPLLWYAVGGIPGLVVFKVVSTMDSMVGFKTPRYLRFGWCGARLDDVMNFLPARLSWLGLAAAASLVPGCSPVGALRIGWRQHGLLPSPNSGWSEAAVAGALRRRLVGPIWMNDRLVTELWLGDPDQAPAETASDVRRAAALVTICGLGATAAAVWALLSVR